MRWFSKKKLLSLFLTEYNRIQHFAYTKTYTYTQYNIQKDLHCLFYYEMLQRKDLLLFTRNVMYSTYIQMDCFSLLSLQ